MLRPVSKVFKCVPLFVILLTCCYGKAFDKSYMVPPESYQRVSPKSSSPFPLYECRFEAPFEAEKVKRTGFALSATGAPVYERHEAYIEQNHIIVEFFQNGMVAYTIDNSTVIEDGKSYGYYTPHFTWFKHEILSSDTQNKPLPLEQFKGSVVLAGQTFEESTKLVCDLNKTSSISWLKSWRRSLKEETFHFFDEIGGSKAMHPATIATFITHPHPEFDDNRVTKPYLEGFLSEVRRFNYPTFLMAHFKDLKSSYFVKDGEFHFPIHSSAGGHNISMPNIKTVIAAGGNLDLCLCNTIRDILKHSSSEKINIVLATDAIYLENPQSTKERAHDSILASEFFALKSDDQIVDWFESEFFGNGRTEKLGDYVRYAGTSFCPKQSGRFGSYENFKVALSIYKGNSRIGKRIGKGKIKVKVILASNNEIQNHLTQESSSLEVAPLKVIKRSGVSFEIKARKLD